MRYFITSKTRTAAMLSIVLFSFCFKAVAQQVKEMSRPRLVVGIVVDQMRWDYLTRFYDRYGDGGFRRMMSEGYNCNRLSINYLPAVTAVGHTSVYTGSVPAFTGIVGNGILIDGKWGTSVSDETVKTVGADGKIGQCSPRKLLVTTMTDELRLATNFRAKTIGVALKDRAAILPAGHSATAAYWYDKRSQSFITSTYYMEQLPQWAKEFNGRHLPKKYSDIINKNRKDRDGFWDLLYSEDTYVQSTKNKHERYFDTIGGDIRQSPYGNTLTADMAIAAIDGENLGNNPQGVTDFLAVSFSSTDMIGHNVGPNAIWIEDVYLRLDQEIARLLSHLDKTVGKGEYVAFLTADHAGSHNIEFRLDNKLPAMAWPYYQVQKKSNEHLRNEFGFTGDVISSLNNNTVFYNNELIRQAAKAKNISFKQLKDDVITATCEYFESMKNVAYCVPFRNIPAYVPEPVRTMIVNGYNPKRCGDLQIVLEANTTEDFEDGYQKNWDGIHRGTQHSVWSPYDTHIPFVIMGKNVRHAWDDSNHTITDIAATVTALLNIQQPSGCVGEAIDVRTK